MSKLELSLALLVVLVIFTYNTTADGETSDSADHALNAIREAEAAGADVSTLVTQFNYGTELVRKAESSDFGSCGSYEGCISEADSTFSSITDQATISKDNAKESSFAGLMTTEVYVVIGAFVTSMFVFYCYKHWKSSKLRKFLDKEIRVVQ